MKATFRHSMTWLHTWCGLLLGWLVYAIFFTGTATYFRPEITHWMQPELPRTVSAVRAAQTAARVLEEKAPQAARWMVDLPDARSPELRLYWQAAPGARFQNAEVNPLTGGPVTARASLGGEFFYRFHFQLMLPHPWGRYLAGVAAMAMFVALFTGVIAHRRFLADLFLFRPDRIALRSWLDFHNVAGVLTLPFCAMISYSALVIFHALYLPWAAQALTPPTPAAGIATSGKSASPNSGDTTRPAAAPAAPWVVPAALGPMLAEARQRWGDTHFAKRIEFVDRGTARAAATFTRVDGDAVSLRRRDQLKFDGVTGALASSTAASTTDGSARTVHGTLYGLHLARFAGPFLRGMLFFLGLLATALVASGLVMWTIKRRPKLAAGGRGARFGLWLVERLNVASIAGLPLAMAAFFWANRLLPLDLPARANWEMRCFQFAWAAALLHAAVRPPIRAWREQLLAGAGLFVALPVLDALTAREFLTAAGSSRDWVYLGFECTAVAFGVFLAIAAGKVGRRAAAKPVAPAAKVSPASAPTAEEMVS